MPVYSEDCIECVVIRFGGQRCKSLSGFLCDVTGVLFSRLQVALYSRPGFRRVALAWTSVYYISVAWRCGSKITEDLLFQGSVCFFSFFSSDFKFSTSILDFLRFSQCATVNQHRTNGLYSEIHCAASKSIIIIIILRPESYQRARSDWLPAGPVFFFFFVIRTSQRDSGPPATAHVNKVWELHTETLKKNNNALTYLWTPFPDLYADNF